MRYLFLHRPFLHRFDHESFQLRLSEHVRRWGIGYLLLIVGAVLFQAHFGFGLNTSPSLPHRFFLIHKGELPQRGDYVAFRWPGGGPYPAGVTFVMGVPGADDVMLNYQSTSFHDALYVREVFGLKRAPEFEAWLQRMKVTGKDARLRAAKPSHPLIAGAAKA